MKESNPHSPVTVKACNQPAEASEFVSSPHLGVANDSPVGSLGFRLNDETCTHPVAPILVGILHGVPVFVWESRATLLPCGDHEGLTGGLHLIIKRDCTSKELLEAVCYLSGRYDLDRALDGLKPIDWGTPGTWSDVHQIIEMVNSISVSR